MRYKVETHPNGDMRTIHVDVPLFSGHFGRHYKFSEYEKLYEDDRKLIDEVVAVSGVRETYFSSYQLSVTKGGVFSWAEVLEPIMRILERRYGELEDISISAPGAHYGIDPYHGI